MMDKEPSTLSIHQKWKKEREKKKGGKWRRQHGQKKEPIKGSNFIFLFLWLQEKKKKKEGKKERKKKGGLSSFVSYKSNHFGEAHCCVTLEWKGGGI